MSIPEGLDVGKCGRAAVMLIASAASAAASVPRIWRGDRKLTDLLEDRFDLFLPLPRGWIHHTMRALPGMVCGFIAISLGLCAAAITPAVVPESFLWHILDAIATSLMIIGFAITFGSNISIALFNRPKFMVPPAMREEPGAITRLWNRLDG